MTDIIGFWRNRKDIGDPQEYIQKLRQGTWNRLLRIGVNPRSSAAN